MIIVPAAAGAVLRDNTLSAALLRGHKPGVRVPADAAGADARLAGLSGPSRDADRDLEHFDALNEAFTLERSLLDELADPAGLAAGNGSHDGILERFDASAGAIVNRLAFDENREPVIAGLDRSRDALSQAARQVETAARQAHTERRIADLTAQFEESPPNDPVERARAVETVHSLIGASGLSGERRQRLANAANVAISGTNRRPPATELSAGTVAPERAISSAEGGGQIGRGNRVRPATEATSDVDAPDGETRYGSPDKAASDLRALNNQHAGAPLVAPPTAAERYQGAIDLLNADWPDGQIDYGDIERRLGVRPAVARLMGALARARPGQADNSAILAINEAFGDEETRKELGELYAFLQSTDDPHERQALFGEIAGVWAKHDDGTVSRPAPKATDQAISADFTSALRALFENAGGISGEQFITHLNEAGIDVDMGLAMHALLGATPQDADDQNARLLIERAFQDMPQVQAVLTDYLDELQTGGNPADARARVLDALEPMLPFLLEDPSAVPSLRPLLARVAAERRNIDAQSSVAQLEAFGRMVLDAIPGIGNVLSAHDAALAAIAAYDAFEAGENWEGTKDALAALVAAVGAVPALSTIVKGGKLAANAARGMLRLLGAASRSGRGVLDDAAGLMLRRRVDGLDAFDTVRGARQDLGLEDARHENPFARRDSLDRETDVAVPTSDAAAYNHVFREGSSELEDARRSLAARGVAVITLDAKKYPQAAGHIRRAREFGGKPTILTKVREGVARRRRLATGHVPKRADEGFDVDEYPLAISGEGGKNASTEYVHYSDNRGAGAVIGRQLEKVPDGGKFAILLTASAKKK